MEDEDFVIVKKISHTAFSKVKKYCETGNSTDLEGCTFRYVDYYLRTGSRHERLAVALSDYGLALEELAGWRAAGGQAVDFARGWLAGAQVYM